MSLFAARYARAFADVLVAAGVTDAQIESQLDGLMTAWSSSSELREVMADPSVPSEQKLAVLDRLSASLQLLPIVRNLVAVLIDHGRIAALDEVVSTFRSWWQSRQGVAEADILTARELDAADRERLVEKVSGLAGARIRASFRTDPAILGGVVVRVGSAVYDGSLLGRVHRLKEALNAQ